MGWSTWIAFGKNASQTDVVANMNILKSSGLLAAGYNLVHIDDGWQALYNNLWVVREKAPRPPTGSPVNIGHGTFWPPPPPANPGCIVADPVKYPLGMKGLASVAHGLGFRFGMYTSGTDSQCSAGKNHPVYFSGRFTQVDAACFAAMGADLVKVDNCNWLYDPYRNLPQYRMGLWRAALPSSISLYNSHFGCLANSCANWPSCPWSVSPAKNSRVPSWCASDTDLARASNDIQLSWNSVLRNANALWGRGNVSAPGFWSDPDFLVPNEAVFSRGQMRSQFALWCINSAPLIISSDLRLLSPYTLSLLKNPDAIRVDQTYHGDAGDRFSMDAVHGLWAYRKNLEEGEAAFVVVNIGANSGVPANLGAAAPGGVQNWTLSLSVFGSKVSNCQAKNVWSGSTWTLNATSNLFSIPPADSIFILVSNCV